VAPPSKISKHARVRKGAAACATDYCPFRELARGDGMGKL